MPPRSDSELYVGYQPQAPTRLARFYRRLVPVLLAAMPALGALLAASQGPFDPGVFELGRERSFSGTVREHPYPMLVVARPGATEGAEAGVSRYYLVAPGKHGASRQVAEWDGRRVRLEGSLIYRGGQTMIEVAAGSVRASVEAAGPATLAGETSMAGEDLGVHTLRGEIVDSKCYLGVMKPGRGKPHRACATLCIRGGIPPVLRVETPERRAVHFLLVDTEGGAVNSKVLDKVAEPVEITGRVRRAGDLLILAADPATYRRLEPRS